MKKHILIFLLAILVCTCCSCTQKQETAVEKDTFNGEAVSGKRDSVEILDKGEDGWKEYREQAEEKMKTDGSKGSGDVFDRNSEEQIVSLVNEKRAEAGLGPLSIDETMMAGAEIRAEEQKAAFSHTRPDGRSCDTVFDDLSIPMTYFGENLAMGGGSTPSVIVESWMNSEGHRANIMDGEFNRIGVGCYESGNCTYWAQVFAD